MTTKPKARRAPKLKYADGELSGIDDTTMAKATAERLRGDPLRLLKDLVWALAAATRTGDARDAMRAHNALFEQGEELARRMPKDQRKRLDAAIKPSLDELRRLVEAQAKLWTELSLKLETIDD